MRKLAPKEKELEDSNANFFRFLFDNSLCVALSTYSITPSDGTLKPPMNKWRSRNCMHSKERKQEEARKKQLNENVRLCVCMCVHERVHHLTLLALHRDRMAAMHLP